MTGKATGKGLDVKGKSAKRGKLSGYVPFVQIHDESHKDQVAYVPDGVRMRCFYGRECDRDNAAEYLERFAEECVGRDNDFGRVRVYSRDDWVAAGCVTKIDTYARGEGGDGSGDEKEGTKAEDGNDSSKYSDDGCDSSNRIRRGSTDSFDRRCKLIRNLSTRRASVESERSGKAAAQMIKPCWGLECPQSLFWESIVRSRPVRRLPGSDLDTGRPSEPAFQDMNLKTVRVAEDGGDDIDCPSRTAVVWQPPDACGDDPLDPRTLLVAYEERGRVLPVVSDFDCFTVGTRGVPYNRPLPPEQVGLVEWSVERVGGILDAQAERRRRREERAKETLGEAKPDEAKEPSWTAMWLDVLKRATSDPEDTASDVPIPPYGYGDGTSYSMMGRAVERLDCGAVRHGAECFNYKFPQELDRQFLIVSDTLPGNVPWKYVSEPELRELLAKKANEGFSFPLNPKWVLCDPGWKDVYDKLINSEDLNVKRSMATWFPPVSGVRRRIEEVCERHPRGFLRDETAGAGRAGGGRNTLDVDDSGTEAMDLAELQLGRYLALQRAKRKLRTVLLLRRIGMEASVHRSDQNEGGGIDDRDGDKDGDRHRATEEENETAEADEVVTEIRSGSASFASVNARVCT
uniref:Uncharacterized protein n=1 Tax=Odontella aurita TaxID=265563 RepID=A0A7S4MHN7_9STRA